MRTPTALSPRGFSILETMIAMVVLGISLLGTIGALNRGATESRLGQTRQMKMMLADAALQRMKLQDKSALFATLPGQPAVDLPSQPVGTGLWVPDTSLAAGSDPNDFSQGAYFNIQPDGTVVKLTGLSGFCVSTNTTIPDGTICREVYMHLGTPYNATYATMAVGLPAGAQAATAWVRVSRKASANSQLASEVDVLLNTVVVR